MKKLLLLLTLIPGIGLSQSIGLKTGFVESIKSDKNVITGVYGITFNIGKKFQFGIEPSYISRGFNRTSVTSEQIKYKNNYIELPTTIGYLGGEKFLYNGSIGLSPQLLINGSRNGKSVKTSNDFDIDLIFTGGIGYKFNDKISGLVNIRYANNLRHANGINDYISAFINIRYTWQ